MSFRASEIWRTSVKNMFSCSQRGSYTRTTKHLYDQLLPDGGSDTWETNKTQQTNNPAPRKIKCITYSFSLHCSKLSEERLHVASGFQVQSNVIPAGSRSRQTCLAHPSSHQEAKQYTQQNRWQGPPNLILCWAGGRTSIVSTAPKAVLGRRKHRSPRSIVHSSPQHGVHYEDRI